MRLSLPRLNRDAYDPEPPPFLRTWGRVYAMVIVWLAVLIALMYAFTRYFA
jgi:hypothetical protein